VTQSSVLTGSATASQSFTLGPPSTPSPSSYSWYLDFGTFFHMTPHFAHFSSLCPSYCHCIIQTADGSPLSVAGHDTLSSDSFYVLDISFIPD
jgi:hypothetical protein